MNNNNVIDKIQEEVEKRNPSKALHILNGSCMLEKFEKEGKIREGFTYIPFNEAMCWGDADEIIFSKRFIANRVKALNTTEEQYREIVLKPLEPLFKEKFDIIVMWFGDDMFCQMNMLTVMGFLEQIGYTGDLLFCMSWESMDEILEEAYEVQVEGSLEKYRDVICRHQTPMQKLLPATYQMVNLYLNYRNEKSEISKYIIHNKGKEEQLLVEELLKTFPQYGLGDLQYKMIIEQLREN